MVPVIIIALHFILIRFNSVVAQSNQIYEFTSKLKSCNPNCDKNLYTSFETKYEFSKIFESDEREMISIKLLGIGQLNLNGKKSVAVEQNIFPAFFVIQKSPSSQAKIENLFLHPSEKLSLFELKKAMLMAMVVNQNAEVLEKKDHGDWIEIKARESSKNKIFDKFLTTPDNSDETTRILRLTKDLKTVIEGQGTQTVNLHQVFNKDMKSSIEASYMLKLVTTEPSRNQKNSLDEALALIEYNYYKNFEDLIKEKDQRVKKDLKRRAKISCSRCEPNIKKLIQDKAQFFNTSNEVSEQNTEIFIESVNCLNSCYEPSSETINRILTKLSKLDDQNSLISFLEILVSSRNQIAIKAALEFVNLTETESLNLGERVLISLQVSAAAASKSGLTASLNSFEGITENLKEIIATPNWKLEKLKWTAMITIGSLLRSCKILSLSGESKSDSKIENHQKIIDLLGNELSNCQDSTCRSSILVALGSTGDFSILSYLSQFFEKNQGRDSISAVKALKSCVEFNHHLTGSLEPATNALETIIDSLVFEKSDHETSTKIQALSLGIDFLGREWVESLLRKLDQIENNEIRTLVYAKSHARHGNFDVFQWMRRLSRLNGTSIAFSRLIDGTSSGNLSYELIVERFSRLRLMKESSMDFYIHRGKKRQHFFSVNIQIRGFGGLIGAISSVKSDDNGDGFEAFLGLNVAGEHLRPYTLVSGLSTLLSHIWSGTASEPIVAFRGNFLLTDFKRKISLINGFEIQDSVVGAMSIENSGQAEISLWNQGANTAVKTRVSIAFNSMRRVDLGDLGLEIEQENNLSGSSTINFNSNTDFSVFPAQICLRMSQDPTLIKYKMQNKLNFAPKYSKKLNTNGRYRVSERSFPLSYENDRICTKMVE